MNHNHIVTLLLTLLILTWAFVAYEMITPYESDKCRELQKTVWLQRGAFVMDLKKR